MELIRAEEVTRVYHFGLPDEMTALHTVSLVLGRGEVAVLKGPSGSGKTSLLSLIGCMSRPTAGKIFVEGKDVVKLPERFLTNIRRETFGFIFQQFQLIRDLTVLDNVLLPLYPSAMGWRNMRETARPILNKLGIEDKRGIRVKNLSGGEQQRVAIARALINDPAVIIADEPTAHLDMDLAQEFMTILADLHGEGKTIIIATHDPFVYEHPLVSMAIAMRGGQIDRVDKR